MSININNDKKILTDPKNNKKKKGRRNDKIVDESDSSFDEDFRNANRVVKLKKKAPGMNLDQFQDQIKKIIESSQGSTKTTNQIENELKKANPGKNIAKIEHITFQNSYVNTNPYVSNYNLDDEGLLENFNYEDFMYSHNNHNHNKDNNNNENEPIYYNEDDEMNDYDVDLIKNENENLNNPIENKVENEKYNIPIDNNIDNNDRSTGISSLQNFENERTTNELITNPQSQFSVNGLNNKLKNLFNERLSNGKEMKIENPTIKPKINIKKKNFNDNFKDRKNIQTTKNNFKIDNKENIIVNSDKLNTINTYYDYSIPKFPYENMEDVKFIKENVIMNLQERESQEYNLRSNARERMSTFGKTPSVNTTLGGPVGAKFNQYQSERLDNVVINNEDEFNDFISQEHEQNNDFQDYNNINDNFENDGLNLFTNGIDPTNLAKEKLITQMKFVQLASAVNEGPTVPFPIRRDNQYDSEKYSSITMKSQYKFDDLSSQYMAESVNYINFPAFPEYVNDEELVDKTNEEVQKMIHEAILNEMEEITVVIDRIAPKQSRKNVSSLFLEMLNYFKNDNVQVINDDDVYYINKANIIN